MKTTSVGSFLTVAILAELLTPSLAIASVEDRAKARMQTSDPYQLVDQNDATMKARAQLLAIAQQASNGSGVIALVSVADGSVWVLKTLQATDPRNVSRRTVLAGMPAGLWCKLFPGWRGCNI